MLDDDLESALAEIDAALTQWAIPDIGAALSEIAITTEEVDRFFLETERPRVIGSAVLESFSAGLCKHLLR